MSASPPRQSLRLLAACLALVLAAGATAARRDAPEILFPVPPAGVADAATPAEPGTPPVLRVQPLIELRWAEVFGNRVSALSETAGHDDADMPPSRLPTGPMYRRDI
jgi:hypothetical protein